MRIVVWCLPFVAHADTSVQPKARSKNVCVVKAEDGPKYYYSGSKTRFWTPTAAEVGQMESKLEPFLQAMGHRERGVRTLNEYLRQYVGVIVDGKKKIYVYAWRRLQKEEDPCAHVMIKDGGCGVWSVTVDPENGTFRDFACNGEG